MDIIFSALVLSLVLLGIHSYFGLNIIRRGIIFADLAISQMSALGVSIAIISNLETYEYYVSLFFALVGAILVAIVSKGNIPNSHKEGFIGTLYVAGTSGTYVILSKSPHGTEVFFRLIATDILYCTYHEIIKVALLYTLIFITLNVTSKIKNTILHEFLFFSLFGLTVTSSVRLAGVIVVFVLLVSPALISLSCSGRHKLIYAWTSGTIISSVAISLSYYLDLPTGYTVVFANATTTVLWMVIKLIREKHSLKLDS